MSLHPTAPADFPFLEPGLLMDSYLQTLRETSKEPQIWHDYLEDLHRQAAARPLNCLLTALDRVFLYTLADVGIRSGNTGAVASVLLEYARANADDFLVRLLTVKLHNALGIDSAPRDKMVRDLLGVNPTEEPPFEWRPPHGGETPMLSIALSTWNRLESLKGALQSLRCNTHLPYEVILFENRSTDGTPEFLRRLQTEWPELGVLYSEGHRFNVPAFNLAFSFCQGRIVGPICDDVRVLPGWDIALAREMVRDPQTGGVQPLVLTPEGTILFYKGGLSQASRRHPWISERDPAPAVEGKSPEAASLPHGSRRIAVGIYPFVRRDLLAGDQPFDPRYLHHWADYDLSLRIRATGHHVRLTPDCRVVDSCLPHHGGHTTIDPHELADLFYSPDRVLERLHTPPSPFWRFFRDRLLFECKWASYGAPDPS